MKNEITSTQEQGSKDDCSEMKVTSTSNLGRDYFRHWRRHGGELRCFWTPFPRDANNFTCFLLFYCFTTKLLTWIHTLKIWWLIDKRFHQVSGEPTSSAAFSYSVVELRGPVVENLASNSFKSWIIRMCFQQKCELGEHDHCTHKSGRKKAQEVQTSISR